MAFPGSAPRLKRTRGDKGVRVYCVSRNLACPVEPSSSPQCCRRSFSNTPWSTAAVQPRPILRGSRSFQRTAGRKCQGTLPPGPTPATHPWATTPFKRTASQGSDRQSRSRPALGQQPRCTRRPGQDRFCSTTSPAATVSVTVRYNRLTHTSSGTRRRQRT